MLSELVPEGCSAVMGVALMCLLFLVIMQPVL